MNRLISIRLFLIFVLATSTTVAQVAPSPTPPQLKTLKLRYESDLQTARQLLRARYTSALDTLVISITKSGNLDGAAAVQHESNTVKGKAGTVSTNVQVPEMTTLKSQYEVDLQTASDTLQTRYITALTALQETFTKRGDLAGALAVRQEVAAAKAASEAQEMLKQVSAEREKYDRTSGVAGKIANAEADLAALKKKLEKVSTEEKEMEERMKQAYEEFMKKNPKDYTQLLNTFDEWTTQSGDWSYDKKTKAIIGRGDSSLLSKHQIPSNAKVEFKINVKDGMRPRVWFQELNFEFANEGFDKIFSIFGDGFKADAQATIPYSNNIEYKIAITLLKDQIEIKVDDKLLMKGKRTTIQPFTLRLQGGDGWSRGTTVFSDFRIKVLE